jgi:hypothetical protein
MARTVVTVIENVCLSRRWKADIVFFRSCIQTLASLTHLVAQKPDQTPAVQSVHSLSRTKTRLQHAVATKPYVKTDCLSNHQKSEFVGNIFHI